MITDERTYEYYQAMLDKKSEYEGVFYVGVTTTGVFCRPTCPARKPYFKNCQFYENAEQALLASFRPCKRCQPLSHPNHVSPLVRTLVAAVEADPQKQWTLEDFQALSVDESTARRQFKKRFGMTFVEYARARRIGLATQQLDAGEPVIEAQLEAGYDSSSGFRDAFVRLLGDAPARFRQSGRVLKAAWLDTRLGPVIALADDESLYLLEFADRRGLEQEIERLRRKTGCGIIPGVTLPIRSIEDELKQYFAGSLRVFQTPLHLLGTSFQQMTWNALLQIPYGETRTYSEIALSIGRPTAYRAVASANAANPLAVVVPCHRLRNTKGEPCGYGGGLVRKKWLMNHEKGMSS